MRLSLSYRINIPELFEGEEEKKEIIHQASPNKTPSSMHRLFSKMGGRKVVKVVKKKEKGD